MSPVKYPNAKKLKSDLAKKELHRCYLFLGEEEGEKDKCISMISSILFSDQGDASNYTRRFHCENNELMEAADFALSSSMFSSRKLCIMYNIDGVRASKESRSVLDDLFSNIPDDTTLIVTTIKNRPPDNITAAFLKKFEVIQFWRYFDNDIHNYIMTTIRKNGQTMEERALNLLIERTGRDIKKIDEALELIRYSGSRDTITYDTVETIVNDSSETSVYDFLEYLFRKEKRALVSFRKLIEEGVNEGRILFEIIRQVEQLEKYYQLTDGNASTSEAMDRCGIYKKNQEKFLGYTRHFDRRAVNGLYKKLAWTDYRRKSGQTGPGIMANPVFNLITEMIVNDT